MRVERCEERHAQRVDADLRRAGEDQCLMRQSDRCGQRAARRGTPRGWMLTLEEQEKTSVSCANQTDAGRELRGDAQLEGGC
mmetsp:Transcript_80982/g.131223  ORF Transcript_80982/g.131223 Transcript_80982/m.131223 type:complete len:82 (+) Transcript_80982:108-353(+)